MINSYNEWDRLKRVVVGDASHANWPRHDPVFSAEAKHTLWKETPLPQGPVPQWIIDEANQDLQTLADTLTSHGVEVLRPTPLNFQVHDGLYNYCPRDRLIVHGSTIINPAMMYPCRDMELQCYHDIVDQAAHYHFMPRNEGLVLDAANVLRLGPDKMLFLESASGNRAAYDWLCRTLPDVDIELCNFYAGVHIDSTIVALNKDTFIVNGSRVTADTVPKMLQDKTIIMINDVVAQGFHEYPYASKWIALNMLSIDPRTVIVDAAQELMIGMLEALDFTVIPLTLRHSRTLGGGFHCVTLDLERG
jgi:N-dimethylarginine dimethylaminohydrolase